jgi:hypothetical protein
MACARRFPIYGLGAVDGDESREVEDERRVQKTVKIVLMVVKLYLQDGERGKRKVLEGGKNDETFIPIFPRRKQCEVTYKPRFLFKDRVDLVLCHQGE